MTQLLYNNEHAQQDLVTRWKISGRRSKVILQRVLQIEGISYRLQPQQDIMNSTETDVLASESRTIPSRRIVVNDPGQIPIDYSTTPGGTIFSTTPGGKLSIILSLLFSIWFKSRVKEFTSRISYHTRWPLRLSLVI